MLELANAGVLPAIPAQGSVGASGDLAPLAHLACVLIGEGQARAGGRLMGGREAMQAIGRKPFVLGPKEGLALLNGTQVSTALALAGLLGAERLLAAALVAGALSLEAIRGSVKPLDARIHAARCSKAAPSPARTRTAAACRTRTRCAACRRSWAPASTTCGMRRRCW